MDSRKINSLLRHTKEFIGTFARDKLPFKVSKPAGLIANTDPISKPGEHWVAIYIDETGFCEYFDPYGLPPLHIEFEEFMSNNSENGIGFNSQQLQCLTCVTCGFYCVEYIRMRCKKISFCEFLSYFTKDPYNNDLIIRRKIANLSKKLKS
jgi:hypothetical protein